MLLCSAKHLTRGPERLRTLWVPDALAPRRRPEVPIWPEPVTVSLLGASFCTAFLAAPAHSSDAGLGSPEVTAHPSPGRFPHLTACQSPVLVCATPTLARQSERRAARSADTNGEVRAGHTAPLVCCGARRPSEPPARRAGFCLPRLPPSDAVGQAWGRGGGPDSHLCHLSWQQWNKGQQIRGVEGPKHLSGSRACRAPLIVTREVYITAPTPHLCRASHSPRLRLSWGSAGTRHQRLKCCIYQ